MQRKYDIKFGRKNVKPFTKEDINNVLIYCKKKRNATYDLKDYQTSKFWDRNYIMCVLGINLAFRIEDILMLKVNDFKNGYIYIRERKTRKEQSFELNPSLLKDIQDYIKRNQLVDGEYLFFSRKGKNKPITRQRANQIINEIASELKIGYPVGCHSLRKYFARCYYESTGDIIGLKEMLNHGSERVTLLYICWNEEAKNERRKSFYVGS